MSMRGTKAKREEEGRLRERRERDRARREAKKPREPMGSLRIRFGALDTATSFGVDWDQEPDAGESRITLWQDRHGQQLTQDPPTLMKVWKRLDDAKPGRWVIQKFLAWGDPYIERDALLTIVGDGSIEVVRRINGNVLLQVPARYVKPFKAAFEEALQNLLRAHARGA